MFEVHNVFILVSNISPLILLSASRSASHSHFPHFTYFLLRSFTGTCQQNLPANLLADVDIFQEYVRQCTRNLNKMKTKKSRFPGRCWIRNPLYKISSVIQRRGTQSLSCQINPSTALCFFTSSGFFHHQLLLPNSGLGFFMALQLFGKMFWFGKQFWWVSTVMDHCMLESPLVC